MGPDQAAVRVENGYVMVHPMTGSDGSYTQGTQVTLGFYPDVAGHSVTWEGVDTAASSISKLEVISDREVLVRMASGAQQPTQTQLPDSKVLSLVTPTPTPEWEEEDPINLPASVGTYIDKWGSQGSNNQKFESPQGIAVGSDGYVYVADTGNHRIMKFDSSGTYIT